MPPNSVQISTAPAGPHRLTATEDRRTHSMIMEHLNCLCRPGVLPRDTLRTLSAYPLVFIPIVRQHLYSSLAVSGNPALDVALPARRNTHMFSIQPPISSGYPDFLAASIGVRFDVASRPWMRLWSELRRLEDSGEAVNRGCCYLSEKPKHLPKSSGAGRNTSYRNVELGVGRRDRWLDAEHVGIAPSGEGDVQGGIARDNEGRVEMLPNYGDKLQGIGRQGPECVAGQETLAA
ncbi:hypothetical protein B9479_004851 [Cryptococcus floricola]|uniref:Uncharacterized protein n=1 Tax=Cryptococcus floricola TaxID=2591691 RepID=A0A5D3ASY5_9TREE|nr:hypothetical protein B9479_004851 [Cryptococcus floricola]